MWTFFLKKIKEQFSLTFVYNKNSEEYYSYHYLTWIQFIAFCNSIALNSNLSAQNKYG